MRNYSRKLFSGFLCITLLTSMGMSGAKIPNATKEKKSVYDEIKKTSIPQKELNQISKKALTDGKAAAEQANQYTSSVDYEAAVNYALTAYYETEDYSQLKDFESTIDSRSEEIVKGYEEAAKERAAGDSNGYEAGTVLVSFNRDTTRDEIEAVVEAEYGKCESLFECYNGEFMAEVSISLGQTVDMAEDAYSQYSVTGITASNDYMEVAGETTFTSGAADYVNDTLANSQYYLDTIKAREAWDVVSQMPHQKVLVGVIDTGIQVDHPDMQGMISPDSGDATYDEVMVKPFSQCESTYTTAHGTYVAGVIAAKANNGLNVAGVASCYNNDVVEILALQATTYFSSYNQYMFSTEAFVRSMNYCMEKGTKVINFSGSGKGTNAYYERVIKEATNEGIIFVCSAGNDSTSEAYYPSDVNESISVVATNSYNQIAAFSNYGLKKDICAPGDGILTLSIGSSTAKVNGTSFSSPITAAVVAMMCSVNNSLNYIDVKRIITETATDIGERDRCKGGLINAYASVKTAINYDSSKPIINPEQEGLYNVSKYKKVTTSSNYDSYGFPNTNLLDNKESTKWISQNQPGQTIVIDLEHNYEVNNVEILYERTITADYKVLLSQDGQSWTEIANEKLDGVSKSNATADLQKARYVKIEYLTNTSYVTIFEIKVWGYNIVGEEETETLERPLEVYGLSVTKISTSLIGVYWQEDSDRVGKGYKYNIYVNGSLYRQNLDCEYTVLSVSSTGVVVVRVTALLNGFESVGITKVVYMSTPEPTAPEPTTVEPTTVEPTTPEPTVQPTTEVTTEEITTKELATEEETTTEQPTEEPTTKHSEDPRYIILDENIAREKTAYSSSNENQVFIPKNAFDGDMGTRWASGSGDNEWIYVDLEDEYNIARIKLFWEGAFASEFKLQVSSDASNWEDVATLGDTYCRDYDVEITPVSARYVRMLGVTRGTIYGYSLYEMEIYAAEFIEEPDDVLLSVEKTAYSSSDENNDLVAARAFDGDIGTRWASGWTDNEWIYVDLDKKYHISYIDLIWEAAYASDYQIQISDDGQNWEVAKHVTTGQGGTETVDINADARYVKMQGITRGLPFGYSLYEMNVFGY